MSEKKEIVWSEDQEAENEAARIEALRELKRTRDNLVATYSTPEGGHTLIKLVHDLYLFRPYKQQNAGAYAKEGKREYMLELIDTMGDGVFLELYNKAIMQEKRIQEITDE